MALLSVCSMQSISTSIPINAANYDDKIFVNDVVARGKEIEEKARALEIEILEIVNSKIGV